MAGASDISAILSQAGRIEKITQNPFVQSEVARQILTEDEAKQRIRKAKEVSESDKVQGIAARERERNNQNARKKAAQEGSGEEASDEQAQEAGKKHLIDVLV
jgi:hypothetical protein